MTAVTYAPQGRQDYHDALRTLAQASVEQHFEAFRDIAWDDPDFAIDPTDERFILSDADEVGRHRWYKALPVERQIEVGIHRYAQVAKVGRQFEQILIGGLMNYLVSMENNNPEFRYAMHEVTEETHHIQMFQETVNRSGANVYGAPRALVRMAPLICSIGAWFPELFFVGILAGEEPIDHLQKSIMRSGGSHPLVDRVMQIHIAEEARHIGFAHQYLEQHLPDLNPIKRQVLAFLFPLIMRGLCDVIMVPSKPDRQAMGIPPEVAREIWWNSPSSEKLLRDLFADVRMLADNLGIRKGPVRWVWRRLGIDGPPARFRGAPSTASA